MPFGHVGVFANTSGRINSICRGGALPANAATTSAPTDNAESSVQSGASSVLNIARVPGVVTNPFASSRRTMSTGRIRTKPIVQQRKPLDQYRIRFIGDQIRAMEFRQYSLGVDSIHPSRTSEDGKDKIVGNQKQPRRLVLVTRVRSPYSGLGKGCDLPVDVSYIKHSVRGDPVERLGQAAIRTARIPANLPSVYRAPPTVRTSRRHPCPKNRKGFRSTALCKQVAATRQ